METLSFTHRVYNETLTAPGGIGGECVDLANVVLSDVYHLSPVRRNAIDWQGVQLPGWRWTGNTPRNWPMIGSLVVWGPYAPLGIGQYGHIALLLDADINTFLSLDQNWIPGSPCTCVKHTYGGVLGWLTPPH